MSFQITNTSFSPVEKVLELAGASVQMVDSALESLIKAIALLVGKLFFQENPSQPLTARAVSISPADESNLSSVLSLLFLSAIITASDHRESAHSHVAHNTIPPSAANYLRGITPRSEPQQQNEEMPQQQDEEMALRRDYGIADGENDIWTGIVERNNNARQETAQRNNVDGKSYLQSVITDHKESLEPAERATFTEKLEESDPDVFIEIPRLAVNKALASSTPLTSSNTPNFMHKHLSQLEKLRQDNASNPSSLAQGSGDVWKGSCAVATQMSREADCIAAMGHALSN